MGRIGRQHSKACKSDNYTKFEVVNVVQRADLFGTQCLLRAFALLAQYLNNVRFDRHTEGCAQLVLHLGFTSDHPYIARRATYRRRQVHQIPLWRTHERDKLGRRGHYLEGWLQELSPGSRRSMCSCLQRVL